MILNRYDLDNASIPPLHGGIAPATAHMLVPLRYCQITGYNAPVTNSNSAPANYSHTAPLYG
jgi:hypothetical protein